MTAHSGRRKWLRPIVALTAVLTMLTVGGCANLPDSSQPQALRTLEQEPAAEGAPPPVPGRDPHLLLRDFLQAISDPNDGHLAARQYMTPGAATRWNDRGPRVVVEQANTLSESRSENEATFILRGRKVGELAADNSYHVGDGVIEHKIEMTRVDGEWRIDELPDGVVMDSATFAQNYRRSTLYFVTTDSQEVVPDLRWLSVRSDQSADRLIDLLLGGPQPFVAPAVRNLAGDRAAVRGGVTQANGDPVGVGGGSDGVRIDFTGLEGLGQRERELFAAEVVLSLSAAEVRGPYLLLIDGEPLDERFAGEGWSVEDLGPVADSVRVPPQIGLHALRDGTLVEVTADRGPQPVPGDFGTLHNLESVGLSPDGERVAAVAGVDRQQRSLVVGSYGRADVAFAVLQGESITRPSWTADGNAAWAVVDGGRVIRAVVDPATSTVTPQEVDAGQLFTGEAENSLEGPITELRISGNGVTAALIAEGKIYVAMVLRRPDGSYALSAPQQIAAELGTAATSLDWYSDDTIALASDGTVDPVRMVKIDGFGMVSFGSLNLTPPVRRIAASTARQFVADSRAVLELTRTPDGGDPYWREVRGLGADAVPVLPG